MKSAQRRRQKPPPSSPHSLGSTYTIDDNLYTKQKRRHPKLAKSRVSGSLQDVASSDYYESSRDEVDYQKFLEGCYEFLRAKSKKDKPPLDESSEVEDEEGSFRQESGMRRN